MNRIGRHGKLQDVTPQQRWTDGSIVSGDSVRYLPHGRTSELSRYGFTKCDLCDCWVHRRAWLHHEHPDLVVVGKYQAKRHQLPTSRVATLIRRWNGGLSHQNDKPSPMLRRVQV